MHITIWEQHCIDTLTLDNPLKYARLVLKGKMGIWANTQDDMI